MTIKTESGPEREFTTGARKQAAKGKGAPSLFPGDAYLEICKHFEDGAEHYEPRNWEKGIPLSKLIDSLERHIAQEKMGLTDESHDRALAWNAVVYLATKLRIKAGILPKELDDLCGVYRQKKEEPIDTDSFQIFQSGSKYYIYSDVQKKFLWHDLELHSGVTSVRNLSSIINHMKYDVYNEGYYSDRKQAELYLGLYLARKEKS